MKKILVISSVLCSFLLSADFTSKHTFEVFRAYDYATKTATNTLMFSEENVPRYFCIIIPDAHNPVFVKKNNASNTQYTFAGQDIKFALGDQPLTIPASFIRDRVPTVAREAKVLILDWLDSDLTSDLEQTAGRAVNDIKNLMRELPQAHYTVIGLGRGGLTANRFIHDLPKQVVFISLGTPFAKDVAKYPKLATLTQDNISTAYVFYNSIDYRPTSGLHPASINKPTSQSQDTYFLRTIANNREQPIFNITFLKFQTVLEVCTKARMQFPLHHDLSVAFSNMKPETNGTLVIRSSIPANNQNAFQIRVEKTLSSQEAHTYKKAWGNNKALVQSDGVTPARSQYRLSSTPKQESKKLSGKSA